MNVHCTDLEAGEEAAGGRPDDDGGRACLQCCEAESCDVRCTDLQAAEEAKLPVCDLKMMATEARGGTRRLDYRLDECVLMFNAQISRLAKKLPVGDLKTMAAELEVAAAERSRSVLQRGGGADDDELDLS